MSTTLTSDAPVLTEEQLSVLFEGAHTTNTFISDAVDPALVERAYADMRWAPTAMNTQPLRLTIVESADDRERLVAHLDEGNQAKTQAAPLSVVVAFDSRWHDHLSHLAPHLAGLQGMFDENPEMREGMGRTNGLIQLGYLLLALRAHGLQVGPMTGMNFDGIDAEFHAENGWKTLAVVNVGHAPNPEDENAQRPRGGRFDFHQIAQVL